MTKSQMKLLAAEFDLIIPAPFNHWLWIAGIVAVVVFACMWWLVFRAVRKAPNVHNHADDWVDLG